MAPVCNADCSRGDLRELGLLEPEITVGEVKAALASADRRICINGKQVANFGDNVKLASLDLGLAATWTEVLVCPNNSEEPCCPEAVLQRKPFKLGLGAKYLTLWIVLAAGAGVLLGYYTELDAGIASLKAGHTNILSAIAMIVMLLPPFAAVKYNEFASAVSKIPKRVAILSLIMNWIVGPFLTFGLGMATLHDKPDLLQGVLFIGAARCIAMVMVWTALAGGDAFLCVSLVLLNSLVTVVAYAPMVSGLAAIAQVAGIEMRGDVGVSTVFINVATYLGIPFALGVIMWCIGHRWESYWSKFLPRFSPVGLFALLLTIFIMFCEQAKPLLSGQVGIGDVFFAIIPLLLYFAIMFAMSWISARLLGLPFASTVTLAFTGASNNFELALASSTAIFGTSSNQAVATVLGPLIEIPVMLLMVYISGFLKYGDAVGEDNTTDSTANR